MKALGRAVQGSRASLGHTFERREFLNNDQHLKPEADRRMALNK